MNDPSQWDAALALATERLCSSYALLIVAGAGIGVDSGLPDYRGPDGFWRAYPLLAEKGISMEHMSSTKWFTEDPCFAWGCVSEAAGISDRF